MSDVLNFSVPGKPEYVQMLRLAIGSVACKSGFDVEKVEDITVAVSEACKLVTCHGRDGLPSKYDITVEVNDSGMKITVSDLSRGHTIEKSCQQCLHCPEDGNYLTSTERPAISRFEISWSKIIFTWSRF